MSHKFGGKKAEEEGFRGKEKIEKGPSKRVRYKNKYLREWAKPTTYQYTREFPLVDALVGFPGPGTKRHSHLRYVTCGLTALYILPSKPPPYTIYTANGNLITTFLFVFLSYMLAAWSAFDSYSLSSILLQSGLIYPSCRPLDRSRFINVASNASSPWWQTW